MNRLPLPGKYVAPCSLQLPAPSNDDLLTLGEVLLLIPVNSVELGYMIREGHFPEAIVQKDYTGYGTRSGYLWKTDAVRAAIERMKTTARDVAEQQRKPWGRPRKCPAGDWKLYEPQ